MTERFQGQQDPETFGKLIGYFDTPDFDPGVPIENLLSPGQIKVLPASIHKAEQEIADGIFDTLPEFVAGLGVDLPGQSKES